MRALVDHIRIPPRLLPGDGRFGCGPSKVRVDAVDELRAVAATWLGTSHRQAPVRAVVRKVRQSLAELFDLPPDHEVVIGNGGATTFWDVAVASLVRHRSQHLVFGEFSSRFAVASAATPWLAPPNIVEAPAGTHPEPAPITDEDLLALTHNETSTGVMTQPLRPADASDRLVAVDATSAAGALPWDPSEVDIYYFAPQKVFGADGGVWVATLSPAAVERVATLDRSGRWVPASLDLQLALDNSRQDQTYNTPALATLFLLERQLDWLLRFGGLPWAIDRTRRSASTLYDWAEGSELAAPFVTDAESRSTVVATIDFEPTVDAEVLTSILRANGILDTEPYRKLGRNQIRVGMFPAVDPADVEALTACIDHVLERIC